MREKVYVIVDLSTNKFYTGNFFEKDRVWSNDIERAEQHSTLDDAERIVNATEEEFLMWDKIEQVKFLEIQPIYVKKD